MKYYEIKILTKPLGIDPVLALLLAEGIESLEINNPEDAAFMSENLGETEYLAPEDLAHELDKETSIVVYADDGPDGEQIIEKIKVAIKTVKENLNYGIYGDKADFGSLETLVKLCDDNEWKDNWKEYLKPCKVGSRFTITQPWQDEINSADEQDVIVINPGMAFGTGLHETTALTLELMEKYIKPMDKVLDVGCGTGILSIAASKFGAVDTLGIDIDEEAVRASKENIALNNAMHVSIKLGDLTKGVDFKANIIVANLLTNLIIRLTGDAAKHLEKDGIYIMSGILIEHEERVQKTLTDNNFEVIEIIERGEWCAIAAKLK